MRAELRLVLERDGVAADLRDRLVLAVDEACCNIIRHAYAGGHGDIVLSLQRDGDVLEFELRDDAPGVDPSRVTPRDLAECRAGGLGVNFIDALMDGWRLQPRAGGVGNVLWMWKRVAAPLEELP
jgi:sigma-B regulation protein RsbU (phosphoserine phosphatase)